MPIGKNECRGEASKDRIVREFDLLAIGRFAIASDVTIDGCCGELSGEQIVFQYTSKTNPKDEGQFSVGEDCAQQFLSRIRQPMPEEVNPFASSKGSSSVAAGGVHSASGAAAAKWHPLNKEVYRAIMLWCSLNGQIPKYSTARILEQIAKNPGQKVDDKQVYELFKVLATYKKSLADLVQAASSKHTLKNFSFPQLTAMASKNWIDLP